ncbi:hypothetical protein HMPREF0653_00368 [Prevotella disiens JCM 6334 = ATCC 29426]|uniref:Uncharacterized protein n=3 Tax=Prevotella disiens TaxID=28130 RepID=E1KTQ1_9BACT|nr:hypothetical protein HMPREF9296_1864 [Prevotella disiens FB035-09AN]ERJ80503.1 hypothetical protein HMPREF0653_00368 [Prevotella disiens JCM 6334 = ATCC 29426]SUB85604.1 Uncharacterised protein [Prevotella disiens]
MKMLTLFNNSIVLFILSEASEIQNRLFLDEKQPVLNVNIYPF